MCFIYTQNLTHRDICMNWKLHVYYAYAVSKIKFGVAK
jgi:hypothetical protein